MRSREPSKGYLRRSTGQIHLGQARDGGGEQVEASCDVGQLRGLDLLAATVPRLAEVDLSRGATQIALGGFA